MYSFQTKFNAKVFWQPCVLVLLCIHYSQETQTPKRTKVHDFFFHQMKVHELDGRSIKIFQNLLQVIKKFKNLKFMHMKIQELVKTFMNFMIPICKEMYTTFHLRKGCLSPVSRNGLWFKPNNCNYCFYVLQKILLTTQLWNRNLGKKKFHATL